MPGLDAEGSRHQARLSVAVLAAAPPPVRRFAVWRTMNEVAGGRPISFDHVQAVMALLDGPDPRSLDLPGQTVERFAAHVVLRRTARGGAKRVKEADASGFDHPLPFPGEVVVPQAGCAVAAEQAHGEADLRRMTADPTIAMIRGDLFVGPWRVRSRRPGDRFHPFGAAGKKKLHDFFIDRKIARLHRDLVPLVVDHLDRIVWVAGFTIDEAFRVTDPAQGVIILKLKHLGGFA
jgi:tRNA(Ile)-lysidine synthase